MPRWRSRQRVSLIIWRSWVRASHGAGILEKVWHCHICFKMEVTFSLPILGKPSSAVSTTPADLGWGGPQQCSMPRWRSRQRVSLIIWRSWVRASHGAGILEKVCQCHICFKMQVTHSRGCLKIVIFSQLPCCDFFPADSLSHLFQNVRDKRQRVFYRAVFFPPPILRKPSSAVSTTPADLGGGKATAMQHASLAQ